MKKVFTSITVLLIAVLFVTNANAQTDWVQKKMDNKVSVKFPKEPSSVGDDKNVGYKFVFEDGTICSASLTDLEQMGLDSATLASLIETEEFFEQFKVGFTSQMPGAEIKKSEIAKWNSYVCYNIEGEDKEKGNKSFFKCIFIGSKMYVFTSIVNAKGDVKNKDVFFQTIELIK